LTTATIAGSRVYIQERNHNNHAKHRQRHEERGSKDLSDEMSNENHLEKNEYLFSHHNDILTDRDNEQQQNTNGWDTAEGGIPNDKAMLESLQIDALWKVYKIELDSIVRQACRRLLNSWSDPQHNVFLPSHISDLVYSKRNNMFNHDATHPSVPPSSRSSQKQYDGWIVSDPNNIDGSSSPIIFNSSTKQQELVAHVLIRMGNIMIERSKVGTSWMV
jgi:hypothetical protein